MNAFNRTFFFQRAVKQNKKKEKYQINKSLTLKKKLPLNEYIVR